MGSLGLMRLILTHSLITFRNAPELEGTFAFDCMEDFTVGPLRGWPDAAAFGAERAAYWQDNPMHRLPDGEELDYSVWTQSYPEYDWVNYLFTPKEDHPALHRFEEIAPDAVEFEIWIAPNARSQIGLWYTIAELERIGVKSHQVSLVQFPEGLSLEDRAKLVCDLLHSSENARRPVHADWARYLALWQAAQSLPAPFSQSLTEEMSKEEHRAVQILSGRCPDPKTGLNNIQARLLRAALWRRARTSNGWAKMAWVIGEAMAAGWDDGDNVGDGVLQNELEALARQSPPLFEIKGEGAMRFCEVRLTAAGCALAEAL